ncbi:MAG: DUF134 domain-containing protein [Nanoarchaeota archaeon]
MGGKPRTPLFKPAGIPAKDLQEIRCSAEEFEALRLKDYLGNDQVACAERMGISQPTFHRILRTARHKISRAIVEGSAISIEDEMDGYYGGKHDEDSSSQR